MPYPIMIGCEEDGTPRIGAEYRSRCIQTEVVMGVQIKHRVVAKTPTGYRVMTPTRARDLGYDYEPFPGPPIR
jgi:hypothetical protein